MRPAIVAVVGGKKSGKTLTIEVLIKEMTRRGYEVAAIKHIVEPGFTIDTKGKDTWRFARAGAKKMVAVSIDEIAVVEKRETGKLKFEEIVEKCVGSDVVFVEGFKKIVSRNKNIHKIFVARSAEELQHAFRMFSPIIAFTGNCGSLSLDVPCIDAVRNPSEMVDLLEKAIS